MIEILTQLPHTEEEILTDKPIKFKIGDVKLTFPLLSYSESYKFNQSLKSLGLNSLIYLNNGLPMELADSLSEVYEDSPALKLFDPEFGLPYYIIQFTEPTNRDDCINNLKEYAINNPGSIGEEIHLDEITNDELKKCITEYFWNNCTNIEAIELFNKLCYLQYNIKKKAIELLQSGHLGEVNTEADAPQSVAAQAAFG